MNPTMGGGLSTITTKYASKKKVIYMSDSLRSLNSTISNSGRDGVSERQQLAENAAKAKEEEKIGASIELSRELFTRKVLQVLFQSMEQREKEKEMMKCSMFSVNAVFSALLLLSIGAGGVTLREFRSVLGPAAVDAAGMVPSEVAIASSESLQIPERSPEVRTHLLIMYNTIALRHKL